jgi:5-oxoprolinase (ATP-hydrolysing)
MRTVRTYFDGAYRDTAVHDRDALQPGDAIVGPAIILESTATIVVEPGWRAAVTELSDILLTDCDPTRAGATLGSEVDLITLELFNNHFASIAERMGATLQKTALSTNVKERLDFSCALFTAGGDLVVNAPHIPVHLGAMSQCVKQLIAAIDAMRPGEVYVTNDPFRGGSHLPDVTVITPVFAPGESRILFFTASRAHHAEIGGITPGSMPPGASNLAEEGVLIQAMRLVADEASRDAALRERLSSGRYPSRSIEENIADIHAQAAANRVGVTELLAMVDRFGFDVVEAYMNHIQRAAETQVRLALGRLPAGRHAYRDALDNGAEIAVTVTITHAPGDGRRMGDAIIDFTGTDAVQPNNLNANPAIVASAVLYCLRCLVDEEIPLNGGMLAPVTLIVPEGCLLNPPAHDDPAKCAAVSGGNVETSQRVVDVIFGALGVVAASQGTMNNLVFGQGGRDAGFGYYETIGGGAGAGPTFDGADAVHTHMTNTRLTDPEVLEARYPVRLERFAIRKGSGGAGAFRGGDGILRSLRFLAPMEVSLLTGRRTRGPYGVDGGEDGEPGCNRLQRAGSQTVETLGASVTLHVEPDDVLTIETPGGGGFGRRA